MNQNELTGTYGSVVINNTFAIKHFFQKEFFCLELFYLSVFQNENVSKILAANCREATITMKAYDGSLHSLMKQLSYVERVAVAEEIIKQILPVINALHSRGVSHRDITLKNIFYEKIGNRYHFVLGDFSMATVFRTEKTYYETLYRDPCNYCTIRHSDLWMLGASVWHFLCKSCAELPEEELQNDIGYPRYDMIFNLDLPVSLTKSLASLMHFDGYQRIVVPISNPLIGKYQSYRSSVIYHKLINKGIDCQVAENILQFACNLSSADSLISAYFNANALIKAFE